ncbi:MAG: MauE/DoxX family redox-associated membrane protein [Bacteroidota bacterium]
MKSNSKTLTVDIISSLFILLFIYAASSKLLDYQKFSIQLGKSPLLSPFSHWVVWLVPLMEIGVSGLLLFKRFQYLALYASFSLMVIFSAYIITILNFSEYIPCSCGGVLEKMSWMQHFWFNTGFIILSAGSVIIYPNKKKTTLFAK